MQHLQYFVVHRFVLWNFPSKIFIFIF